MGKIFDALEKSKHVVDGRREPTPVLDSDAESEAFGPKTPSHPAATERPHDVQRLTAHRPPASGVPSPSTDPPREIAKPKASQAIPLPDFQRNNLVTEFAAKSFAAEQFRMLRTNILFPANGKSPRCIMVTSALPDEGKSFVSANLAITFAQHIDKHVLLVDCDMRKPTIHGLFGYASAPGLSDYLTRQRPLEELILRTPFERLRILPGGPPPPNPAELLSSNRMSDFIEEIRSRYDDRYIVIDSPPPQLTAETSAMARLVDGIVLVVRCGQTSRDLVDELVSKQGKDKIIGVVANWVDERAFSFYGRGKYAHYGQYYQGQ